MKTNSEMHSQIVLAHVKIHSIVYTLSESSSVSLSYICTHE